MEFNVSKENILQCLYTIQGIVERRSTIPILANVQIESGDGKIFLTATDLEIGAKYQCTATIYKSGALAVNARKLYEIVREFPEGSITITLQENNLVEVVSGKSHFKIVGMDPREFPTFPIPTPSDSCAISLAAMVFGEMMERTIFAVSTDETRLNLNGVYLETKSDGGIRMVATDGHRLAVIDRTGQLPRITPNKDKIGVILPRKGLMETKKLLEKSEDEKKIELVISDNLAQVLYSNKGELFMRLIDGEFPDYHQVIPTKIGCTVKFICGDFLGALRRVATLTTERFRGVKLLIENGRMEVSVTNPDLGEATEELQVSHQGEKVTIGFNCRYLIEFLNILEQDEAVTFGLNDEVSPGILQSEEDKDYHYVIMPMRLF